VTLKELLKRYGGKTPAHGEVLKVPAHTIVVSCASSKGCLGAGVGSTSGAYYYLLKYFPARKTNPVPEMTGADLVLSGTRADFGQGNQPVVLLQFTNHGSDQFERTDVSATLGKDSLAQAWHAALVGLIVVAAFLLLLYRFLGLVAVIGLTIYCALYYAAILLFNVTLTLPGFAGLILTIGVAADANVVVFERIKEEVRAGRSVKAAIAAGYGKGFHTILDANVVTAITAMVLFLIAVADVKGFALMLLIG